MSLNPTLVNQSFQGSHPAGGFAAVTGGQAVDLADVAGLRAGLGIGTQGADDAVHHGGPGGQVHPLVHQRAIPGSAVGPLRRSCFPQRPEPGRRGSLLPRQWRVPGSVPSPMPAAEKRCVSSYAFSSCEKFMPSRFRRVNGVCLRRRKSRYTPAAKTAGTSPEKGDTGRRMDPVCAQRR